MKVNNANKTRIDVFEKVTGNARYSGDYNLVGMLHAKILWPKYPAAKIIKIDTSEAEKMSGVEKVITRKHIVNGTNLSGIFEPYDRPVLVGENEEVRFRGDALAIVVAETEEIAAEAVEKIEVEYEILPGIFTVEEAMEKSTPCFVFENKKGNIKEGFSKAEVVFEREFEFPYIEHAYMEPESGYAFVDGQGVINVCYGSQNLGRHHRMICESLGLSYNKVRLFSPYIGGGFGGKHAISVQIYLTLAAHVVKKPVKLVWTREESFAGSKRHKIKATAKLGLTKEGKMVALQAEICTPAGPYMGYTDKTLTATVREIVGPYSIEHVDVVGKAYHTNNIDITAFRGFGWTEGTFMIETLSEKAAKELNISSEDIRKSNLLKDDQWEDHLPRTRIKLHSRMTVEDTLSKALDAAGPKPKPRDGKKVGRGIATAMATFDFGNNPGYKGTGADMTMFSDGSINVQVGFPEVGQGITGVITRLISDVFEIEENMISIIHCDTHTTPKSGSLGASRATINVGNAVLDAARRLKNNLEQYAKEYLETDERVRFENGNFYSRGKRVLEFGELMDYCYIQGKNLSVQGWYEGPFPEETLVFPRWLTC
jgi:CO/xanthine dehydrogenase Mo-binding subunit